MGFPPQWFRGGLVFETHRLFVSLISGLESDNASLGLRVITQKKNGEFSLRVKQKASSVFREWTIALAVGTAHHTVNYTGFVGPGFLVVS